MRSLIKAQSNFSSQRRSMTTQTIRVSSGPPAPPTLADTERRDDRDPI